MSFTENLYLKRQIQQLHEENIYLKNLINEALNLGSAFRTQISPEEFTKIMKIMDEKRKQNQQEAQQAETPPANETPYEKRFREAKMYQNAKKEKERRARSKKEFDAARAWWEGEKPLVSNDEDNQNRAIQWDASNPEPPPEQGYGRVQWSIKREKEIPYNDPGTDYEEFDKKQRNLNAMKKVPNKTVNSDLRF